MGSHNKGLGVSTNVPETNLWNHSRSLAAAATKEEGGEQI